MPYPARKLTVHGRTRTLAEWASDAGVSVQTLRSRLDLLGWTPERAVSERCDRRFRRGGRHRADSPRPVPKLREDDRGRAFVRWREGGQSQYRSFGAWGSADATAAYRRFVAEWASGGREVCQPGGRAFVGELVVAWIAHVEAEYTKLGRWTSERHICRAAGAKLNELYGATPAADFGPRQLRAVRSAWVGAGLARSTCNAYTDRVRRMFRWAAGQSIIPAAVPDALRAVEGLRAGRTDAPEPEPVAAVADAVVAATVAKLPATDRGRTIADMIAVQRLAGLRPQHLAAMRVGDLDRRGDVWRYDPPAAGAKGLHIGRRPVFYFGPRAQQILAPRIEGRPASAPVFAWSFPKSGRVVAVTVGAYRMAVRKAARLAGVPHWYPHQLRHALATEVAERFRSIETAAAAIGDTVAVAEAVYVHVDPRERVRVDVARAMG